ncbi:AaceriAGR014Wp [[Ashbya] aceris (nom. inval.)]|nr:AaceriAGR014Wp [[Ashbya] aceris (nom. inval.)]
MGQGGSKIKVTATDKAILQLKLAKDNLHRHAKRTDSLIESERSELRDLARSLKGGIKQNRRARLLLKRIHYQQRLLDQCSDQLINLENMLMTIEFKLVEKQFVQGLARGNEVLKKLNREFSGVEQLMDDVAEQVAYQEEIDQALSSGTVSVGGFQDELDKELEMLAQEVNAQEALPELPSTEGLAPPQKRKSADKEEERAGQPAVAAQGELEKPMLAS